MTALGFLNADGTRAALPANARQETPNAGGQTAATATTQGNPGEPDLPPVQLLPAPDLPSQTPVPVSPAAGGTAAPRNYGEMFWPFTTARVQLDSKQVTAASYPYRAAGKLVIALPDGGTAWCTASLIKKGLVVTAAHCVSNFGKGYLFANWTYYPGLHNGKGAYGSAKAIQVYALKSYLDGTDTCVGGSPGVICQNDVAVLVLAPKGKAYIGTKTGWFGYQTGNAVFTPPYPSQAQITALGYPKGLDFGQQMIRNDSFGEAAFSPMADNNLMGSLMDGGSSGGPWLSNFGMPPVLNGLSAGKAPAPNVVVGVTSWIYADKGVSAIEGASQFTDANIGALVRSACADFPAACAP